MTSIVSSVPISENKMGLAKCLHDPKEVSESRLKFIFWGTMLALANATDQPIWSFKDLLWDQTSPDRLTHLQHVCVLKFCERILKTFDEEDIQRMLNEWKETNSFSGQYSERMKRALHDNERSFLASVEQEARRMTTDWIPAIEKVLKEQNVTLNIRK